MKYPLDSGVMMYIPSFIKFDSLIQMCMRAGQFKDNDNGNGTFVPVLN
jgi:hypothetical protein